MTLRTRRWIFYTLVALFFIVGALVVGYAEGWRVDLETWRLEKIGGIYIRSFPEDTSITLNGKPIQNQSGFLNTGTLISDLLPKTYRVALKAPRFDAWQENAVVLPSLVTQFKYAVLVPANGVAASSSILKQLIVAAPSSTLADPFDATQKIVAGQNKISIYDSDPATTTASTTVPGKNVSAAWITGNLVGILQNNGAFYLYTINTQTLAKTADDTRLFAASPDGTMVATLETRSLEIFALDGSNDYYRFNLPNIAAAQKLIWYKDDAHLFVVYQGSVSFLDLSDANLINFTNVGNGTSPFYDPDANMLYLTNPSGRLVSYDFSS